MNATPPLPPLHDLVRAYDPTHDGRVSRLLDYFERRPGTFTYNPSRQVAAPAFSHGVAQSQIRAAVTSHGSPSGRAQNLEVADHLWTAGDGRRVSCYPLRHGRLRIRRDLSIRVLADFLFIENGEPNVCWFQPRRTFSLSELGLGVIASVFRMTFLVDDLAHAGVELLDLSAPSLRSGRLHVRHTLAILPTLSEEDVTTILQELIAAYDAICTMGRDWKAGADARRQTKPRPPMEAGLFG